MFQFSGLVLGITLLIVCCFVTNIQSYTAPESESRQPQKEALVLLEHGLRSKRHVPEPMLDPYSILGFLSFATFVFSILYNQYKMKPSMSSGSGNAPGGPPMFLSGEHAQKNKEFIVKMIKKLLVAVQTPTQKSPKPDEDSLDVDATDYYDSTELMGSSPGGQSQEKNAKTV